MARTPKDEAWTYDLFSDLAADPATCEWRARVCRGGGLFGWERGVRHEMLGFCGCACFGM